MTNGVVITCVGNELFVSHGGGWQFVGQLDTKFPSLVSLMVNLLRGVFITCDIPMKQFILKLDEDQAPNRFVIANLDETVRNLESLVSGF